ncbi:hypothetical protein PUN28_017813 [Cardiocondyla obscurior]|uniref:Uncharacterized protein n=1 Tax=Cardiocondyla obscurior TaxID=286306 RepID=A0AAW2EJ70_9HYME
MKSGPGPVKSGNHEERVQMKSEALMLLSQKWISVGHQARSDFKLMAEQIQERFYHKETDVRHERFEQHKEQNKCLRLQVDTLRQEAKCSQLQTDLQTVLDEKHELEMERDAFKCKAASFESWCLNATKPVPAGKICSNCSKRKELTRQSLSKAIKLGVNSAAGTKESSCHIPPQKSAAAVTDLRSNKILALRICELESTVQSPTTKLLEGYTNANVDLRSDSSVDNNEESNITSENNIQCNTFPESQVMQQLQSIQMSLPKNLGVLVQKALNNLKDNDKQKI